MTEFIASAALRSLLQAAPAGAPGSLPPPPPPPGPPPNPFCTGTMCMVLTVSAISSTIIAVTVILLLRGLHLLRVQHGMRKGSVPAQLLIDRWHVPKSARRTLSQWRFIIRTPDAEEDVLKGEECPVCLRAQANADDWVVFDCCHATCSACFKQLIVRQLTASVCPLCRAPLAMRVVPPGEGDAPPEGGTPPESRAQQELSGTAAPPVADVEAGVADERPAVAAIPGPPPLT